MIGESGANVVNRGGKCKHFAVCGGCENQHIPYPQQLENKRARLAYLLQAAYSGPVTIHAREPYGYRNRMDFIIGPGLVGFRQQDPKKLVAVEECPISESRVTTLLAEVKKWISEHKELDIFDPRRKSGVMKYAVIRAADDTVISFMLNEDSQHLTKHVDAVKKFAQTSTADNVVIAYTASDAAESVSLECFPVKGSEYLTSTFCGKRMKFHSQGFFQNNLLVAQDMVEHVGKLLDAHVGVDVMKTRVLVDAYGGVGTFGIVLASRCKEVISIESYPAGTTCCEKNAKTNGITNMRAINDDAGNIKKYDIPSDAILLLDPPRSGLGDKMIRYLLERPAPIVIYVSCNPSQLAKELSQLARLYSVAQADAFDMFPQTNHLEAVIVLKRKA